MRVFWFTNCLIPQAHRAFGEPLRFHGGGWMGAMLDALLSRHSDLEMCIATADQVRLMERVREGRIEYIRFPQKHPLALASRLVQEYDPDVLHVHGTEYFYGLVAEEPRIASKAVVSLQGLIGPYSTWPAFFGNLTPLQVLRCHRLIELAAGRGLIRSYLAFQRNAVRERRILSAVHHVMGRTDFDRAYALAVNPRISYHHVNELLRKPFWEHRWDIAKCTRHSIIFTNAGHPRKGVEVLLEAFRIIRARYPAAALKVAGEISSRNGYGRYLRRLFKSLPGVELLGSLDADAMARALCASHLFVSPSFIDNSPNALCEAQLIGMPAVSTYVGGVPSLVEDRRTGLLVSAGDPSMLAWRIAEVFDDDLLAGRCGENAREAALTRHNPQRVTDELYRAYEATRNGNR